MNAIEMSNNPVSLPAPSRWLGKRLTFLPELDAYGGYGLHATQYVRHWTNLGIHVSIRAIKVKECEDARIPLDIRKRFVHCDQPEPWELILSPASFCPMGRRKSAYFTMYESSRWSPKMVKLINRADAAIVPCEWNRQGLIQSGVIVPIFLVPLGYGELFRPQPMDMTGPCVFGAAGRMSHGAVRKGLNAVIDAFLKEFPNEPDVQLWIKGFSDSPTKYVSDRRIVVREGFLTEPQLAEWFSRLTCFVSAARGEAWGLMQLEAMASGRPVIAAIHGGLAEFMTPENSYSVDFDEELSGEAWCNGGSWAVPSESHMRHLMRRVYRDRQMAQAKGVAAAEDVKNLTWMNSATKTLEVLESLDAI